MPEPVPRPDSPTPLAVPQPPLRRIPRRVILIVAAAALLLVIAAVAGVAWSISSNIRAGNQLAVEMDRFVAEQYPDYRVVQREPFTDYHGSGAPGNNYFLARKSEPRFVLLVAVVKPAKIDDRILALKLIPNGDYLTSDDVFSRRTIDGTWVNETDIDQVIADYVRSKPSPSALIVGTAQAEGYVALAIAGKARHTQGLGYMSPFDVTHMGEAKQSYETPGDETVTKYDWTVTAVGQ
jgi:hypothetical protein